MYIKNNYPKIFKLIETGEEKNVELALQLLKGIESEKKVGWIKNRIKECFFPVAIIAEHNDMYRNYLLDSKNIFWWIPYIYIGRHQDYRGRYFSDYKVVGMVDITLVHEIRHRIVNNVTKL